MKTYNLPTGTKIVLDGFATKTVNWGLETIDAGPSPTTWFRGEVNGKIIWITSHDLMWMFQSESNFKSVNQQTFEALKFQQRMPQPFKRNPDGSAEHVSWLRHYESEQKNIAEWNCELK